MLAGPVLLLGVSACQALPPQASVPDQTTAQAAVQPGALAIEIDRSTPLVPTLVRYERSAQGILVSGRIEKPGDSRGRIRGYADIALLDAQGQVLGRHIAPLQGFSPSRKNPDWADFATTIEPLPAGVVGIRVAYHADG
jgi:hypothetical protein